MDSRYRFLTLGTPWTQSMPSRDVNAVTRLAEASWRCDKKKNIFVCFEGGAQSSQCPRSAVDSGGTSGEQTPATSKGQINLENVLER